MFWLDDYNYDALTRPAYSKVLCFPHYLVILHAKRNEVRKRFEARNKQPKELMKDAVNVSCFIYIFFVSQCNSSFTILGAEFVVCKVGRAKVFQWNKAVVV